MSPILTSPLQRRLPPAGPADAAVPAAGAVVPRVAVRRRRVARRPISQVARRHRTYRRGLLLADVVALLGSAVLVTIAPGHDWLKPQALVLLPVVVLLAKLHRLYHRDELVVHKTTLEEAPALLQLSLAVTLLFWLGERAFVAGQLSHRQALAFLVVLWTALVLLRAAVRRVMARRMPAERVLFVGDAWTFDRLRDKIFHHCADSTVLVGRVELASRPASTAVMRSALLEAIGRLRASRVILCSSRLDREDTMELIQAANELGVRVSIVPRVLDVVGSAVLPDDLGGMTLLGLPPFGLSRSSLLIKRALDLVGASVLLLMLSPVLAVVAAAIKLDSAGPVLFLQDRVGRDGRHFRMRKFRTMFVDADLRKDELRAQNEAEGLFKIAADPRVTRVGRFLRRRSLDEIPQLLNVWRGEMSLVGPRPLVVDEDAAIKGYGRHRLMLMPGMTGPWQILPAHRVPLPEMVKMDYIYVASWSLWTDMKILIRTVPHVLLRWGL
jgi:exopolysaccharide biosynthesis polyprenyl glycosylphosphotransferase